MDMDTIEDSQALIPRCLNMNESKLSSTEAYDVPLLPYWLSFATLNALGKSREAPKEPVFVLNEGTAKNMIPSEASECVSAISSYPYAIQKLWPNIRLDGKSGQHFNLTQIPQEVEVSEFDYALDY